MLGSIPRAWASVCSILLVTSILFSPTTRKVLSHRFFVFLGSISFPMYLVHGTLIKTVLCWVFYELLPAPMEEITATIGKDGKMTTTTVELLPSILWRAIYCFVWVGWMGLLISLSVIWRNKVDALSIQVAKTVEEIMAGKRVLLNKRVPSASDIEETEKLTGAESV